MKDEHKILEPKQGREWGKRQISQKDQGSS